ncbi:hypothetical protein [Chromohalobacter nigrandesensis]|uniref:hypothetical protein n=1 Tax=Chromohalobacter nigrandesensis TaxID=119863 RepID=UPI001FF11416|nr:hypothetical protein [Chromohalobacter nigrandesensis]MCK0743599.1 hypothetical protein [Chromohalobacter nigrandesensis]
MQHHQLLNHPLFEERPFKDVLEPFGFELSIKITEPPIDPEIDSAQDIEAYDRNADAYIDSLSFDHRADFTEIYRGENEDGDIVSVAVRAKHVFAQLLLCADSGFAHVNSHHHRAYADVYRERMRQLSTEGFSRERDDGYVNGQLGYAAASYAFVASLPEKQRGRVTGIYSLDNNIILRDMWPGSWSKKWWKPRDRRRDLVKAGALILAEIERLDRAAARQGDEAQ